MRLWITYIYCLINVCGCMCARARICFFVEFNELLQRHLRIENVKLDEKCVFFGFGLKSIVVFFLFDVLSYFLGSVFVSFAAVKNNVCSAEIYGVHKRLIVTSTVSRTSRTFPISRFNVNVHYKLTHTRTYLYIYISCQKKTVQNLVARKF